VDFLDRFAAGFRFDHPLDDGLPAPVRQGIEKRLALLREDAARVRGYAKAERWDEAKKFYQLADRLYIDVDHWLDRGRLKVAAAEEDRKKRQASSKANEAKKRQAAPAHRKIVARATELRESHKEFSRQAIAQQIRREWLLANERAAQKAAREGRRYRGVVKVLSVRQMLRVLDDNGVK
jgi:hypothetical protein